MSRKNWTLADTAICAVGAVYGSIFGAAAGAILLLMLVVCGNPHNPHWLVMLAIFGPIILGAILGAFVLHKRLYSSGEQGKNTGVV